MRAPIYGDVPGYPVGSTFESRTELSQSRVHPPPQSGIAGPSKEGATSIVLSGGYEDDLDLGDVIIYTGQGGRDPVTQRQVRDQLLTLGNLALVTSKTKGLPVRVIRGSGHKSQYSPSHGYRYDGLFYVEEFWHEVGRSGCRVWRYRLVQYDIPDAPTKGQVKENKADYPRPHRAVSTILRVVRDTQKAREVKSLYKFACQVCGVVLEGPAGPYAEAAHIRPLGMPHNGPDTLDNLLCLCPNHHVLFDLGMITITDDLRLIGYSGDLITKPGHVLNQAFLQYHREHRFHGT